MKYLLRLEVEAIVERNTREDAEAYFTTLLDDMVVNENIGDWITVEEVHEGHVLWEIFCSDE